MSFVRKDNLKSKKRSFENKKFVNKISYFKKGNYDTQKVLKVMSFVGISFLVIFVLGSIFLYNKYISPLPPVEELKNMQISQSSIIYDKDGKVLYKIFKENRTYVDFADINKNIINAIVAGEDQRFWTTPGFDMIGIFRSVIVGMFSGEKIAGTSGLSQQLMKVTYLSGERKIERKIKELYLSWKLNKVFSKEKIVELYLNKIEYGSNAFGIEQAAQTFFNSTAKDLDVLQSSILASLPKGPTYYSPYNHKDRLLGYIYLYNKNDKENQVKILNETDLATYTNEVKLFSDLINNLKFKDENGKALICGLDEKDFKTNLHIDGDGCTLQAYSDLLTFLNSVQIKDGANIIEYQTGRKDYILGRMLEDKYIDFDQYKKAVVDSISIKFSKYKEAIKYPYFVMYIKEYLENKYGKEVIDKGGFKIYSTLDSNLQNKAEDLIDKYGATNASRFNANNSALISLDNANGGILAMVGGRDYFDTENGGNNNMTTSKLQPGSSFKPFVYSLAMANNPIGSKTPVYDLKTTFPGGYTPANFNGQFEGKMNISTALNASRNIPAVKMFFMAGGEKKIIDFMTSLGVKGLQEFKDEYFAKYGKTYEYGASMALGTVTLTPLELAGAYSTFANLGDKKEITPIIKIIDSKGNVIEDNTIKPKTKNQVMSAAQAYIMNYVLSDSDTRPAGWNKYLTISGRKVAAKTGTSTKQFEKDGKKYIYPRNLWTIGYTPQITTVVWAGNTDGRETTMAGDGLNAAGPIWRDFMNYAHKDEKALFWVKPEGVKEVSVSSISGLLPGTDFPEDFLANSMFLNVPTKYDNSLGTVSYDSLCNGKVTDETPKAAIKKGYLLNFHSLQPDNRAWENPVKAWVASGAYKTVYGSFKNVISNYIDEPCKGRGTAGVIQINSDIKDGQALFIGGNSATVAFKSDKPISSLQVLIGDNLLAEIDAGGRTEFGKDISFTIPDHFINSEQDLIIRAVDADYYSKDDIITVMIGDKDKIPPEINLKPLNDVNIQTGVNLKIFGNITDNTKIKSVDFFLDKEPLDIILKEGEFSYNLDTSKMPIGQYIFKVEAYDTNLNESTSSIKINITE